MDPTAGETPINPYQTPQTIVEAPSLERLIGSEPLRFEYHLTSRDVARALRATQIRPEIIGSKTAIGCLALPFAFLTFLMGLAIVADGPKTSIAIASLILLVPSLLVSVPSLLFTRLFVKAHKHITGDASGFFDATSLRIEQSHQTRIMYLDALVAAKTSKEWLAFAFEQTRSQMEFLPRSGFAEQGRLEDSMTAIEQLMPDTAVQTIDLRRLDMPREPSRFTPGSSAIHFAGKLFLDDLQGTEFMRANRKASRITMLVLLVSVLAIGSSITLINDRGLFIIAMAVFVTLVVFVVLNASWRTLQARRKARDSDDGQQIVWCSRGWFDENGIVSATVSGESQTRWPYFAGWEITERAIALRSPSPKVWYLFGRDQFEHDDAWSRAGEWVRSHVPA